MQQAHYYEVNLNWKIDRIGELSSPILDTSIEVATPPEFTGGVPNIWSPEHFYAGAINSCFMTTFLAIAENSKMSFESFECKTVIKLERPDKKYMITEAVIYPKVKMTDPEKDRDRMLRILEKAEENCLVTNSMLTKVRLEPQIS
ncbi:MAG: OsmC family protein [Chitinophagaceae bacterium]|nr:OsmC family protein [Chitinophagaceae bacterium]MCW5915505.1 OsmC family protein [Chitinophagaceae bacterium]MCZ2397584.1 OsmC family protein [Chitinophagales bacterium]